MVFHDARSGELADPQPLSLHQVPAGVFRSLVTQARWPAGNHRILARGAPRRQKCRVDGGRRQTVAAHTNSRSWKLSVCPRIAREKVAASTTTRTAVQGVHSPAETIRPIAKLLSSPAPAGPRSSRAPLSTPPTPNSSSSAFSTRPRLHWGRQVAGRSRR